MCRMSVAICSILAAKISTSETTVLGSTPKYMRKLLGMVRAKMESNQVDITLKFTLSALWNLTGKRILIFQDIPNSYWLIPVSIICQMSPPKPAPYF